MVLPASRRFVTEADFADPGSAANQRLSAAFGRRRFRLSEFGAKEDYRRAPAAMSAGSSTLTSTGNPFTQADIGKVVAVLGAGSGGADLVSTISGVTNSNTAVLANNASTTRTLAQSRVNYGTDDTAAIQAAIDAASVAGGTIEVNGSSMIAGPVKTGTSDGQTYAGQILIPARRFDQAPITLKLSGTNPAPLNFWAGTTNDPMPVEDTGHTIWRSTATSGNVIDCVCSPTRSGANVSFTNTMVLVDNLILRLPSNTQAGGLNFRRAISAGVHWSTVGPDYVDPTQLVVPTGTAIGVQLPNFGNGAFCEFGHAQVYGMPVGLWHSEHAYLADLSVDSCNVGIQPHDSKHASHYSKVLLQRNAIQIKPSFNAYLDGTIVLESKGVLPVYQLDIDDISGYLKGNLTYWREGALGIASKIAVWGCENVTLRRMDTDVPNVRPALATATYDSFVGDDNTKVLGQADTGQVWFSPNGLGTFGIVSNQAKFVAGGTTRRVAFVTPHNRTTTQSVRCQITPSPTVNRTCAGVILAAEDEGNCLEVLLEDDTFAADTVLIRKVGGGATTLATGTASLTANTPVTLRVERTATTITAFVNDVQAATYTLTAGEQTTYNGRFKAGLTTLPSAGGEDGGSRWKDFRVV